MSHPYQATIDMMKAVINKLPCVFPADRREAMEAAAEGFERDERARLEDIEKALVAFGLELWPYCEAHEAFHKIYGADKEKRLMAEKLSPAARAEFERFIKEGGDIESVKEGEKFESFFSPDIRAELVAAEIAAHDAIHEEMEKLVSGSRKAEFEALLKSYGEKMAAISGKISELEALAARSPERAGEIMDKAKTFREGFAYVERAPSFDDVSREIQYYVDIMEV
jgi:hypothetical protein